MDSDVRQDVTEEKSSCFSAGGFLLARSCGHSSCTYYRVWAMPRPVLREGGRRLRWCRATMCSRWSTVPGVDQLSCLAQEFTTTSRWCHSTTISSFHPRPRQPYSPGRPWSITLCLIRPSSYG